MDLLISTSTVTAFLAGMAALFAPCCITVLLPTYLASVFKQRATVFLMTFVYFLGVLVVFLPLGLGVSALGQLFRDYHQIIFTLGGSFLLILGFGLLLGQTFSLPMLAPHPKLKNTSIGAVFVLGIFSAIATTCCAPVLAGVLALSALPGSIGLGLLYTLAYVLGMVAPLFLIAAFLDKFDFTKRFMTFRKSLSYSLFGKKVHLTYSSLMAGAMFVIIGIATLYSAKSSAMSSSAYQLNINLFVAGVTRSINHITKQIPEMIWGILLILILGGLTMLAIKSWRELPSDNQKETK